VNFASFNNITVKEYTMFPRLNIHKSTWTSDEKHNQVNHIFIDRGWHLRELTRSFITCTLCQI
jgi:hypothetical protein